MTEQLQKIEELSKKLQGQELKRSGIFTNSLLKTSDTTQIIRDARDEEVVFFQGKKMNEIDYEMINEIELSNSDKYGQYEMAELLEIESENGGTKRVFKTMIAEVIQSSSEYLDDVEEVKAIFKRIQSIKKIWGSSKKNMLDLETNQLLSEVEEKLQTTIQTFNELGDIQVILDSQRNQLTIMYKDNDDE